MTSLTVADLLAYIDGAADPETVAEVESSNDYLNRAQALSRLQGRLKAKFYRVDCPDPLILGEFHLGLLGRAAAADIRRHLVLCPHCREELDLLPAFLEDPPGLRERVRVIVAELLSGGESRLSPALGLRGGEGAPLIYIAGDVQLLLEVQADARRPERSTLTGLVMGMSPTGINVELVQGESAASAQVDELGNFSFTDLAAGAYSLRLHSPELEIQIPNFAVD